MTISNIVLRQAKVMVLLLHSFYSLPSYFDAHFHSKENAREKKRIIIIIIICNAVAVGNKLSHIWYMEPFFPYFARSFNTLKCLYNSWKKDDNI
jgi:hypothetical protein